jgi:hypothetical protein
MTLAKRHDPVTQAVAKWAKTLMRRHSILLRHFSDHYRIGISYGDLIHAICPNDVGINVWIVI